MIMQNDPAEQPYRSIALLVSANHAFPVSPTSGLLTTPIPFASLTGKEVHHA
jgi:hypothetical protein